MPEIRFTVDEKTYTMLVATSSLLGLDIPTIINEWVAVALEDVQYAISSKR